ncbi:MAG: DUF1566 domain-containing protein [Treponema sp.]|nr:DUF1566 domain-containing protein [Treponema sp.]
MNKVIGIISLVFLTALLGAAVFAFLTWQSTALKGTVSIDGEPMLGKEVTVNTSELGGSGIITYQWMRNGQPIENSNTTKYTLQSSDKDSEISVTVIRSDNRGSVASEPVKAEGFVLGGTGPGGGIIFYQDLNGFVMADTNETFYHLEAAPLDQGMSLTWVTSRFANTNVPTGTSLGTGRRNTNAMIAADPASPAALACKNFNGGGLNDWFLPSLDELNLMFNQRNMTNMNSGIYWSSSQSNNSRAWDFNFSNGSSSSNNKAAPPLDPDAYYDEWNPAPSARANNVRAIRAF